MLVHNFLLNFLCNMNKEWWHSCMNQLFLVKHKVINFEWVDDNLTVYNLLLNYLDLIKRAKAATHCCFLEYRISSNKCCPLIGTAPSGIHIEISASL